MSELETFLHQQQAEGTLDSSGHFTLAREKALEKMAAFQLPRDTAWALKVVQAVVLSGATRLSVRQTGTDTEFHFDPQQAWTLDDLETAFFDPEVTDNPGLDHLKRALWSVSLNGMRPFHIALDQAQQSLVWTGHDFRRPDCKPRSGCSLLVSHRTIFEGKGLPIIRSFEAAKGNADLAAELVREAFVCPIPLELDGRRLDALQACPTHGLRVQSYPVFLGLSSAADLPPFSLPPGSLVKYRPKETVDGRLDLLTQIEVPRQPAAACLISLHIQQVTRNKRTFWEEKAQEPLLYWVRHGVVVRCEPIRWLYPATVSCAVFASAVGLNSDLTGFGLIEDAATVERRRRVLTSLRDCVQRADFSLQKVVNSSRLGGRVLGGVMLVGGGALAFSSPIHGLVAMGYGAYSLLTAGSEEAQLDSNLHEGLDRLKRAWPIS